MRGLLRLLLLRCRLALRSGPVVAFDVPSLGELQFIKPVVAAYQKKHPARTILIVHHDDTPVNAVTAMMDLDAKRTIHASRADINRARIGGISLFLTSEQYDLGMCNTYSVSMFHGHAAKGLSFVPRIVQAFDGFFLNGPIHKLAFDTFLKDFNGGHPINHLECFAIGYPKSDDLLNGVYSKTKVVKELALDPDKKTIVYAPAFNEGASLREFGPELIEILAKQEHYNVLVKLPIDCWRPKSDFYATGGIDWFDRIEQLRDRYRNLWLLRDYQIDPLLACADVLVTCISSVSFEFMALGKPVVFVETPKYYSGYLKRVFPEMDTESWARRTTVNGGKEFGLVVDKVEDLPAAIETVIANPAEYPKQRERLQSFLLYNRGRAAEAAVATVEDLLARKVKTKRPCRQHGVLRTIVQTAAQRICGSVRRRVKKFALRIFQQRGYTLVKAGQGYIAAQEVVAAARSRGLSVCEYRESLEDNPRKVGRRDRIVKRLKEAGVFQNITTVCEIGTGTGMYLEKILLSASPSRYEVYETDVGWIDFIKAEYGAHSTCRVVCHPCDGRSLSDTGDGSVDLVHAHGVFVYLPLLQSLAYLRECIRVSRPGGFIVFDCYLDSTFSSMKQVEPWLAGSHHWPVVIPKVLLDDLASRYHMRVVDQFDEIHASGTCNYLIWKNMEESAASATT